MEHFMFYNDVKKSENLDLAPILAYLTSDWVFVVFFFAVLLCAIVICTHTADLNH
jgi:hypothetical protein